jgi:hypothetical protein
MLRRIQNAMHMGRGLAALRPHERAQASWARLLETYSDVPAVYRIFFESLRAGGHAMPYAVLTPSYEGFTHTATEKLVCELDGVVHVLERRGSGFEAHVFPRGGVSCLRVRTILLDSSIQITGDDGRGRPAAVTLKFNAVTDPLFEPILSCLRPPAPQAGCESDAFDPWLHLNYKFMNYARRSLLGGEPVLQAVLQPEIRMHLVAGFHRTVFPTHACILTDRELILIREEPKPGRADRYGGIWDYIPLGKIRSLDLTGRESGRVALTVQLPHAVGLECLFEAAQREAAHRLVERFESLPSQGRGV